MWTSGHQEITRHMRAEAGKAAAVRRVYQSFSESEIEGAAGDITHTTNLIRDRRMSVVCLPSLSLTYRKNTIYRVLFRSLQ